MQFTHHGDQQGWERTIAQRLRDILGRAVRQTELRSLRQGLFKGIFPQVSPDENRGKSAIMKAFEDQKARVLAIFAVEFRQRPSGLD
jgi:hypothetical protein